MQQPAGAGAVLHFNQNICFIVKCNAIQLRKDINKLELNTG